MVSISKSNFLSLSSTNQAIYIDFVKSEVAMARTCVNDLSNSEAWRNAWKKELNHYYDLQVKLNLWAMCAAKK